jgi:hypothetical protein
VIALIAGVWLARSIDFTARAPLLLSDERLADRAEQMLRAAGYTDRATERAYGFECCDNRVQWYLAGKGRAERDEILASHRPPINPFWYREHSRGQFERSSIFSPVTLNSPPTHEAGMQLVMLDPLGRLLRFQVQAWTDVPASGSADWGPFFEMAKIDESRLSSTTPRSILPMAADAQWAWVGQPLDGRPDRVRVETAAYKGRPVWFDVQWLPPESPGPPAALKLQEWIRDRFSFTLAVLLVIAVPFMAWRNWQEHRVDTRGAVLITAVGLPILANSGHVEGVLLLWLLYVATEPAVRRNWPDALISWQRLSHGRWRDPLVASHVLVGLAAAVVFALAVFPLLMLLASDVPMAATGQLLSAPSVWNLTLTQNNGPGTAMLYLSLIVLCRLFVRRLWAADLLALAWFSVVSITPAPSGSWLVPAFILAANFTWLWLIRRFGFLTFLTMFTFVPLMWVPHHLDGWLGARLALAHVIPVAVAAGCLLVIVAAHRQSVHALGQLRR